MARSMHAMESGTITLVSAGADGTDPPSIAVDSPTWREWLAHSDAARFRFEAGALRFTAGRRMQQGAWHWYAMQNHQGRRREIALGTVAELTPECLRQAAEALARVDEPSEMRTTRRAAGHAKSTAGDVPSTTRPDARARGMPKNDQVLLGADADVVTASRSIPLLATKLFIPRPRPDLMPRPRLLAQLEAGVRRPLTVLAASAGWGKTSVLSAWCAASRRDYSEGGNSRPIAWVSLDAGDNDPVRFWTYILTALNEAYSGMTEDALSLLRLSQSPALEGVLTLLLNAVSALSIEVVLVLDDYHLITNAAVHTSLTYLLEHAPPSLHLVLATREDPPLPLARQRAQGAVTEMRAADLRFTPEEATQFLTATLGSPLSDDVVQTIEVRSEGWIAGLQLATLSLHGRTGEQVESFTAAFAGSNRYIVDYLVEEVLARQPPEVQTFLLRSAVAERFCAPLCERLLDKDDIAATSIDTVSSRRSTPADALGPTPTHSILEQVERANLFLIPLDDERHWYRYHHLFADALRSRLRKADPGLYGELHSRASAWFEAHGLISEAVQHALTAADFERAAAMIEEHSLIVGMGGQVETVIGWLHALPEPLIRARPRLCLCNAALHFMIGPGQPEEQNARMRDAAAAVATWRQADAKEPELPAVLGMLAFVRAVFVLFSGDLERSVADAQEACDLLSETDSLWYTLARYYVGRAYLATGDATAATEHALRTTIEALRTSGNAYMALSGTRMLADLMRLQGHLRAAAATYEASVGVDATSQFMEEYLFDLIYCFGLGEVLLEWNELSGAERLLTQGMHLHERWVFGAHWITKGYLVLARLQQARGEVAAAVATLDAFAALGERRHFVAALRARGEAMRAQLALAQGSLVKAVHWAQGCGLSAADAELPVLPFLREREYMTLARVLLAQGQSEPGGPYLREAEQLLARLLADAEATSRGLSVLEILLLRALAQRTRRDTRGALGTLARALALAQPEGYARLFADEGAPMAALLTELVEAAERRRLTLSASVLDYARALIALCRAPEGGTSVSMALSSQDSATESKYPVPSVPPLLDPLTERELEVVRLLAEGASNAAIAAALVVTVGTVKKHVFNVCSKLAAQNRTQAVARARAFQLL